MAVLTQNQPSITGIRTAHLQVRRTDIVFGNVAPDRVRIGVTVSNPSGVRSASTTMRLQAAPLGAFVPWRDLTTVEVPPIDAHQSVEVSTEVAAPALRALSGFSGAPPRKLVAELAGDDPPRRSANIRPVGWLASLLKGAKRRKGLRTMPDDPLQRLNRKSTHWAGNINVLIGGKAVERHMAQALRIYPGVTNLAGFIVGERPDEYQFTLAGNGCQWDATLLDFADFGSPHRRLSQGGGNLPLSQWVKMSGAHMILLAISPPAWCERGAVEVNVRQRSTNRSALVEFSLDPNAAGAGCYTV